MAASEQRPEQRDRDLSAVPKNLRPHAFQPGQSGNPAGRPKGRVDLTRRIEKVLLRRISEDQEIADMLAEAIVNASIEDPIKAAQLIKSIQDRDEGPVEKGGPLVSIDARGQDGRPKPPPPEKNRQQFAQIVALMVERGGAQVADILGAVEANIIEGKVEKGDA